MSADELSPSGKVYAVRPNKTALKKEHLKFQQLAERLVKKTPSALKELPLNENLILQISVARGIKGGAFRRQIKHITNLVIDLADEALEFLLDEENQLIIMAQQKSRIAEDVALKLVGSGDDYLLELLQQYPQLDRQQLRNLMLQARRSKALDITDKSVKKLVNYLRQQKLN